MTGPVTRSQAQAKLVSDALNAQVVSVSPDHTQQVLDSLKTFTEPPTPVVQNNEAFILRLPVEMIHQICLGIFDGSGYHHVCHHHVESSLQLRQDRASLANFGASCRIVREITLPLLYQNLAVYKSSLQGEMMFDFTRSLLENSSLGPLVQSIDTTNLNPWPTIEEHPEHGITDAHMNLLTTLARRIIGPEPAAKILDNEGSLKISAEAIWDTNFLAVKQPNGRTLRPLVVFNKLTHLFLDTNNMELAMFGGLFAASPNLETLIFPKASKWARGIPAFKFANLITLDLDRCQLCPRGIKHMLKHCTKLVNFSFSKVDDTDFAAFDASFNGFGLGLDVDVDSDSEVDVPTTVGKWTSAVFILDCLKASAATLQTIEIQVVNSFEESDPDMAQSQTQDKLLKSVTGFPALKALRLSQALIDTKGDGEILVDLIKDCPSLETLEILQIEELPEHHMAQFVSAAEENRFPKLQSVKLDSPFFIHADDIAEMVDNDEEAFENWLPDLAIIEKGPYTQTLSSLGITLGLSYCNPWDFIPYFINMKEEGHGEGQPLWTMEPNAPRPPGEMANLRSVDRIVTGVHKLVAASLNEIDETILPLLDQRLSHHLDALSKDAETFCDNAEQQLAKLIEAGLADFQLSDVCQLVDKISGRHRRLPRRIISLLCRPEAPAPRETLEVQVLRDLDERTSVGTSLDGPLSTPSDGSSMPGSPSSLRHVSSRDSSTPSPQRLGASTSTYPGTEASLQTVQRAENSQARVFELQRHDNDGDPKMSLDIVSCPEFGPRTLDSEQRQKRHKLCPARKLSRTQSASAATAPNPDPPILRKPKPRGRLSTEIFTASDGLTPIFNTPLSRHRPSPSLLAIAGMMIAVGELDRLSLMADAEPLRLFAPPTVSPPSNIPSAPPTTPVPPPPNTPVVDKLPPSSVASTEFSSFPAFVRTPSPPTPHAGAAQFFRYLLPVPAKASEGMGSRASMVGVEGVGRAEGVVAFTSKTHP
ncbi:hypothetical protein QBC39DRAFT_332514 [Podospora conica]|nr:hypothetical protein QBC39DRAFT_332514 [Schizothecium conicum]